MSSVPPSPSRTSTKASVPRVFRDLNGIIQKYIENPLLVNECKFDIRCYLLISRNSPKYLGYYHPGYCRMTVSKYSTDADSITDKLVHLTNNAVQKHDPNYQSLRERIGQTPESVADIIQQEGKFPASCAEYMRGSGSYEGKGLNHDIKRCMVDVLHAGIDKMNRKHGYFDLLGFDFMITAN